MIQKKYYLAGQKDKFAIEIYRNIENDMRGIIYIWANSICIGKNEDTYILPNIRALARVKNLSANEALNINFYEPKIIMKNLQTNDFLDSQTLLGFGETFDNYIIRAYIYLSNIIFIWSVYRSKKNNCLIIPKENFCLIIDDLLEEFSTSQ